MRGLLVDVSLQGEREVLLGLFRAPDRMELWEYLARTEQAGRPPPNAPCVALSLAMKVPNYGCSTWPEGARFPDTSKSKSPSN